MVVGAGDDTGAAIAKAFAREGLVACIVRRPRHLDKLEALAAEIRAEGGLAHAFGRSK
jgi:NAD(P)-dependent dehydrogenase (short-subunit alcohol dehydrogenase family)